MHIIEALKKVKKNNLTLFTTSGHCRENSVLEEITGLIGKKVFKFDFSEVIGLDNYQSPTGTILKSQLRSSEIYKSRYSYYLINGSSSGILALMLSTSSPGEKVLIARNAHKSVINALILSGAIPVWLDIEWNYEWNISSKVSNETLCQELENHPDIKAVWITNPTYEGITSDIKKISEICKKKNVILIVDEAHGALWNFSSLLPNPAILDGADASVQSLHKNASCLTQGAIMHLAEKSKINPEKLQNCLNIINTTSPSFILLASIEASIEYLSSKKAINKINKLIFKIDESIKNISNKYSEIKFNNVLNKDKTKILFKIEGVSGYDLAYKLENEFNIESELNNDRSILALTGIGTSLSKLEKLFKSIVKSRNLLEKENSVLCKPTPLLKPKVAFSPREVFYKSSKKLKLKDCVGLISKDTIISYPPGIPVLVAGEIIQEGHMSFINKHKEVSIVLD